MQVYLIGYMGCGKTTIGKKLAKLMNYEFLDLDELIETEQHQSINELFEKYGEIQFRAMESEMLSKVTKFDNVIVSLGGGTPCFNNNINLIKSNGISIYIKMSVNSLLSRLKNAKDNRPLIKDKSDEELQSYIYNNLTQRLKDYEQADVILEGLNVTPLVLENLIMEIKSFQKS